jgi:prephenate dehydrogenase
MVTVVSIIGGEGKMGKWLRNHFVKMNYSVQTYDVKIPKRKPSNATICKSIEECVRIADIVVLSVPVSKTPELIMECELFMKNKSILLDISSIKNDVVKVLLKTRHTITPISVHPMFGPGAKNAINKKILLVPIRDKQTEYRIVNSIFKGSKIMVIKNAKEHDELMSLVLGLVYYINLIFALVLPNKKIPRLRKYSGTSYTIQSLLCESILASEPSLISSLLMMNPYLEKHVIQVNKNMQEIFTIIKTNNTKKLERIINLLKRKYTQESNIDESYGKLYSLLGL